MYADWEFVLWALLLVVVVLWNFFAKTLRRGRRRPPGEVLPRAVPVPEPVPVPVPVPEAWGRAATGRFPPDWQVLPAPAPAAPDRSGRDQPRAGATGAGTRRWHSRAELRRALVDMAVLGPPRALAPWDGGGAAGEPERPRG